MKTTCPPRDKFRYRNIGGQLFAYPAPVVADFFPDPKENPMKKEPLSPDLVEEALRSYRTHEAIHRADPSLPVKMHAFRRAWCDAIPGLVGRVAAHLELNPQKVLEMIRGGDLQVGHVQAALA